MENTVARRGQLLQSGIEQLGGGLGRALPDPAKRLHGKSEAIIALHSVFSGMVDKLVGKRPAPSSSGFVRYALKPSSERNAERHCLIELARLGDRHPAKPLRLIGRPSQPNQVRQNGQCVHLAVVAKSLDDSLSRSLDIAMQGSLKHTFGL